MRTNNEVTVTSFTDFKLSKPVNSTAVNKVTVTSLLVPPAQAGYALLMVLWFPAALSAIAFTVANTVRAETDRTSTSIDSVSAYYLATGAIDRALLYIQWGPGTRKPDGTA